MPGNLLFADINFPSGKDTKQILNYLYMLREELRYTMGNLGIENFNETELKSLSSKILGDGSIAELQATATAQGASITLLTAYTGLADVVTVATLAERTDTTKTYKVANSYYKYDGTAWVEDTSISSAALTLAAINGQSAVSLKADRIDFTGFTTFLTAADVGASGTTVIDGGRISTGTLYADSLAKVEDDDGYDYIAMQNGFDFRNPDYMNFTESDYTPYSRAIQGLYALSFNGDTTLTSGGAGTAGNAPTPVTGYIRNIQSPTGTISQSGLDIGARYNLRLMGQCFGNASGGSGTIIYSANPDNLVTNETYFQLQIVEAGIFATKYRKESDGSFTQLASATILT